MIQSFCTFHHSRGTRKHKDPIQQIQTAGRLHACRSSRLVNKNIPDSPMNASIVCLDSNPIPMASVRMQSQPNRWVSWCKIRQKANRATLQQKSSGASFVISRPSAAAPGAVRKSAADQKPARAPYMSRANRKTNQAAPVPRKIAGNRTTNVESPPTWVKPAINHATMGGLL